MANEKAHVNGAIERIEQKVEINIAGKLATFHSALQSPIGLFTAGPHKPLAKCLQEFRVKLSTANHGGNHTTTTTAEDLHHARHLIAEVRADRTSVGKMQFFDGTGGKRIRD